ncbi:MAG TPA: aminotransferase class I/II-fold pyridoxal phosphate-dependent enzyme [Luteimonas sp.]|nr:aminotransferase class I/II-fold pyridoxal phosphate-dependent enzyme [Luteimonas sp.]HRO27064.1 aminotransferase class I/II-fold pyridoxal phosphate-dependent enzyme [Luteimonas sp.]HRP71971.1 aminotransferase class I/II-fold pyridoxal phosphate-dependent enzyme [Luteimonas sp.]
MTRTHRFDTLAAHAGTAPDPASGALSPPLQLATTFEHAPDASTAHGYLYQRYDSPNQAQLEQALATLDGAARAMFFATGMTAGTTVMQALPPGSELVIGSDTYFGYRAIGEKWLARWGVRHRVVDMTDLDAVRAALTPDTRLLWAETPSNPLLKVCDIAALAQIARGAGARLLVDGTFATPALQQPLALGADIVLHSATKYLGGHGDVMGGVLAFAADDELAAECHELRRQTGNTASPFAAWLVLRGLRTLPVRIERHCRNAQAVAEFLQAQPRVEAVHYPGLASHAAHALAARQMCGGFGGVLSFEVVGGRSAALDVAGRLRLFTNATSLGSTESLVEHRASIEEPRVMSPQGLLRLSVGLEDPRDLVDDLAQALG